MPKFWLRQQDITDAVAQWTGVDSEKLLRPHGSKRITEAKRLLTAALHEAGFSHPEIAEWMGLKDHSSSIDKIQRGDFSSEEVDGILLLANTLRAVSA